MHVKKFLTLFIVSVMALPVFSTPVVLAVENSTTAKTTTTDSSTTQMTHTMTTKQTLAERIADHKAAMKIKITAAQKQRLQTKCKASQGKLSSAGQRINGLETSRTQVYKNIIDRLTKLSDKLKEKGIDTTELNTDIKSLQTKIDTFNTDLTGFKQVVGDLATMDCEADPEGFSAALEAARSDRQQVHDDAQGVRTYIDETIKPLLKTIRSKLEPAGTAGGQ